MANSQTDWNTPEEVLERVRKVNEIFLDPCSNAGSCVNAKYTYDLNNYQDGLLLPWNLGGLVFVNPPFNTKGLKDFGTKILQEHEKGTEVIALVPVSTATKIWQNAWFKATRICFPDHRIVYHLSGKKQGSPLFSSAVLYFGHNPERFESAFNGFGKIITP